MKISPLTWKDWLLVEFDKLRELSRYDLRAKHLSIEELRSIKAYDGSISIPLLFRKPYIVYESILREHVKLGMRVLEIGSGTGIFTGILIRSGAKIVASDISIASLNVLKNRYQGKDLFEIVVADMESLPFPDCFFDIVTCAGSLSYGDNAIEMHEVHRVLNAGGRFICVDSLHHNPIYKVNRLYNFFRGNRTKSTILRMPTLPLLKVYRSSFSEQELYFFGSLSWAVNLIAFFIGVSRAAKFSDWFDSKFNIDRSAFKFVMYLKK